MSKGNKAELNKLRPIDRIEYDTADGVPVIRLTEQEIQFFSNSTPTSNFKKDA
jgi:hypothetical protein